MANVVCFTFNPFQENTYLVYDETGECIIVDPGCYSKPEQQELTRFIEKEGLRPVRLLNTHCHLDHVFGNGFVSTRYNLPLEIHRGELPVLHSFSNAARMFGVVVKETPPEPGRFIEAGEIITFGQTSLLAILTPGHSPASLSFYCEKNQFVLSGDVLFYGSIGRTDLPGGDYQTLIRSIETQLLPLGDGVTVYSGHGPQTSIGFERLNNPFLS